MSAARAGEARYSPGAGQSGKATSGVTVPSGAKTSTREIALPSNQSVTGAMTAVLPSASAAGSTAVPTGPNPGAAGLTCFETAIGAGQEDDQGHAHGDADKHRGKPPDGAGIARNGKTQETRAHHAATPRIQRGAPVPDDDFAVGIGGSAGGHVSQGSAWCPPPSRSRASASSSPRPKGNRASPVGSSANSTSG